MLHLVHKGTKGKMKENGMNFLQHILHDIILYTREQDLLLQLYTPPTMYYHPLTYPAYDQKQEKYNEHQIIQPTLIYTYIKPRQM